MTQTKSQDKLVFCIRLGSIDYCAVHHFSSAVVNK